MDWTVEHRKRFSQQLIGRCVLLGRRSTAAVGQVWANEVAADDDERAALLSDLSELALN